MVANGAKRRFSPCGRIGRRRFLQVTAGALGAAAWARPDSARARPAAQEELYRLAREEGQLSLYGGGPTAPYQMWANRFQEAFPGITVNVRGGFSNVLAPAIDAQIAARNMEVDITVLQTLQDFDRWKRVDALLPFQPEGIDQIHPSFRDPDGTSIGIGVNAIGYAYNPNLVAAKNVPRSALDFLDARFRGMTITCYPQDDDVTLYLYDIIVQKYGWGFMDRLMANRPQFIRGHLGVVREIIAGRAGLSFDSTGSSTVAAMRAGSPIVLAIPQDDPLPIWPQSAGIFRGAPHPNAAKLYLTWYLAREQQSRLAPGVWSPRRDVPPPDGLRPIFDYSVANDFRDFIVDEPRVEELRRRFERYIGPVQGEPVL
jgi:ABC-type Fe3+ transport system substrate-binding protein